MVKPSSNAKDANLSGEDREITEVTVKESVHPPIKILVVDDEEVVCEFLENLLTKEGYQVHTCLNGQEAIAKLKETSFDLVITDMKMPGIDGLSVLRVARELDPLREVIVITGYASVESAVEVMKLGAYDYISKPFNIDQITIVIDKAIEKQGLLRAAEERDFFKRLSQIDGLTELYNYRTFYELLEVEIGRSERYGRPLSLLMIDLDDLKEYNDTFGHPAGDAILKEVAWMLKKSVRNCDIVARYGGDEFAIILIETDKNDAIDTAHRLSRLVEGISIEQDEAFPRKTLSLSIGIASYPNDVIDKTELVTKADQALYEAKTLGGNQVRATQP